MSESKVEGTENEVNFLQLHVTHEKLKSSLGVRRTNDTIDLLQQQSALI